MIPSFRWFNWNGHLLFINELFTRKFNKNLNIYFDKPIFFFGRKVQHNQLPPNLQNNWNAFLSLEQISKRRHLSCKMFFLTSTIGTHITEVSLYCLHTWLKMARKTIHWRAQFHTGISSFPHQGSSLEESHHFHYIAVA